jgi:hypothetical protein
MPEIEIICYTCLIFTGACWQPAEAKQNILFKVDPSQVEKQLTEAEANYASQPNDLLTLERYTNHGEKIGDPNRVSFNDAASLYVFRANYSKKEFLQNLQRIISINKC